MYRIINIGLFDTNETCLCCKISGSSLLVCIDKKLSIVLWFARINVKHKNISFHNSEVLGISECFSLFEFRISLSKQSVGGLTKVLYMESFWMLLKIRGRSVHKIHKILDQLIIAKWNSFPAWSGSNAEYFVCRLIKNICSTYVLQSLVLLLQFCVDLHKSFLSLVKLILDGLDLLLESASFLLSLNKLKGLVISSYYRYQKLFRNTLS